MHITMWAAVLLGIVEGLTEFLPVSSTAHLTVVEKLLNLNIDDKGITAFTAVIQVGAIVAVIIYFWKDIVRLLVAWVRGLARPQARQNPDYKLAWLVIIGSIPIAIVGFLARNLVSGPLRSIWVIAIALLAWGAVMWLAEIASARRVAAAKGRSGAPLRGERHLRLADAITIGVAQCLALIPGVSRSGATISTGLFLGLDRVAATRLSFLMGIPALVGAGAFELKDAVHSGVGAGPTLVGTIVSFAVAYVSVAWLLRFVGGHRITVFVWYRWAVGIALIIALSTGALVDVAH